MLAEIANTFSNCFKIPELKSRIIFTLVVLAICRLEAVVRIPGLNGGVLAAYFASHAGAGSSMLGMYSPAWIWWYRIQTTLILTTGTMLLMWFGEQITERGIGNGVSLVITIGILARLPQAVVSLRDMFFPPRGVLSTFNFGHAILL